MKKTMLRIGAMLIAVLMVGAIFAACSGSGASSKAYDSGDYAKSDYLYGEEYAVDDYDASYANGSSGSSSGSRSAESVTASNRKLIETVSFTLETKTYDSFITDLETQIKALGGYLESLDSHSSSTSDYRYSSYTVKIPTEKKEDFKIYLSENANVLSSSVDTEDVTLRYIDVESRLKSLRLEQESLEEILKTADNVSDIIEVRDRLSDVIYEIESYEAQLRSLNNDIDYTSFYLSVREVEHESVKEEDSVWQRIGSNLAKNFEITGEFFEDLFVGFISLLPLWIAFGVMGLIALLIVKLSIRSSRRKRAKREEEKENPPKA